MLSQIYQNIHKSDNYGFSYTKTHRFTVKIIINDTPLAKTRRNNTFENTPAIYRNTPANFLLYYTHIQKFRKF